MTISMDIGHMKGLTVSCPIIITIIIITLFNHSFKVSEQDKN